MSPRSYSAFDHLPQPVLAFEDDRVRYANDCLLALLGTTREALETATVPELITRYVVPLEQSWMERLSEEYRQGGAPPGTLWLRLRLPGDVERVFLCQAAHPPGERTLVYVMQDAEAEGTTQRLAEALLEAAVRFVGCREPHEVLTVAADALARQGLYCQLFRLEGEELVSAVIREDPKLLDALRRAGVPLHGPRFPLGGMPQVQQSFSTRRAHRYLEAQEFLRGWGLTDEGCALLDAVTPTQVLEAPLFLEDKPYGLLVARAPTLRPSVVAVLEMFGRQVGAALSNVEHHRRAQEQVEALRKLQTELLQQERLAALGEAAAVVSHEVRNPLAAIINGLAVLRRQLPGTGHEVLGMIEEESLRINQLVKDLLDLARPLEPRLRPVELHELAEQSVAQFQARNPQVTVRVRVEGTPPPTLEADGILLQLALENLLRNAQQASPAGGSIQVHVAQGDQAAVLAVEDQGPGIPEGEEERIFEPFYTRRASGTGLGLALVRRVVEAHHGRVRALKAEGGGARFEISLPR